MSAQHSSVMDFVDGLSRSVLPKRPVVSETETDEPESAAEEAYAPVQEENEGNEGALTRDWIEQMTASVSNIVDRLNAVTDAMVELQETRFGSPKCQ